MSASRKAKNKIDKVTGQAKETIGRATGDARLRNEGVVDQLKADVRSTGERVKDVLRGRGRRR